MFRIRRSDANGVIDLAYMPTIKHAITYLYKLNREKDAQILGSCRSYSIA